MSLKVIAAEGIRQFLGRLMASYRLIAPKEENGSYVFAEIKDPSEVVIDYPIALYPPKGFLLPPKEEYLRYKRNGKPLVEVLYEETPPTVFFGLHPCDLNSLWLLDEAFIRDTGDSLYEGRRKKFFFIVLDCLKPCDEYAFCRDMGTLYLDRGYDILLTKVSPAEIGIEGLEVAATAADGGRFEVDELYIVRTGTDLRRRLVEYYADAVDLDLSEEEVLDRVYEGREKAFDRKLKVSREELPDVLWRAYESPYWEEVASKCLSCGSCNFVCPTCYCFDVMDQPEINLKEGKRLRTWDSCMLVDFARVAGGENFRPTRVHRLRHRFLRKGKYLQDRYGKPGCVGCGRCTRHCLVKINPIEVYNGLYNWSTAEG